MKLSKRSEYGLKALIELATYCGQGVVQAPQIARKHQISVKFLELILLDLQLPKVNGLEVLRRIRADPLTEDIPVVIFTHSNEDRNIIEGYKLGANSFLVKRHDFDEFMKAIQALGVYWLVMNTPPLKGAA